MRSVQRVFFFFNDTATTEIYTLSLHDALPICSPTYPNGGRGYRSGRPTGPADRCCRPRCLPYARQPRGDRKSTRLNSSHANISYAVFCLKKQNMPSSYHNTAALHSLQYHVCPL